MSFSGTFLLTEAVRPGQLYNTQAKLETLEDRTQIIDTDWGVFRTAEVAPPPPTIAPSQFTAVRISSSEFRQLFRGGTLAIVVYYTHQGKAESEYLYAAIGNRGVFGFDEVANGRTLVTVPDDPSPVERPGGILIPITNAVSPGTYDLYAKVGIGVTPRAITPTMDNIVQVL